MAKIPQETIDSVRGSADIVEQIILVCAHFMMKKPHPLVLPQQSRSTTVLAVVMAEMSFHS